MDIDTQTDWSFSPHDFIPNPSTPLFWSQFPPPPSTDNFTDGDDYCDMFDYLDIEIDQNELSTLDVQSNIPGQVSVKSTTESSKLQVGDQILEINSQQSRQDINSDQDIFYSKELFKNEERINIIVARLNPSHDHVKCCLDKSSTNHVHLLEQDLPPKTVNRDEQGLIGGKQEDKIITPWVIKEQKEDEDEKYLENEMKELEKECLGFIKDLESITCHGTNGSETETVMKMSREKMNEIDSFKSTKIVGLLSIQENEMESSKKRRNVQMEETEMFEEDSRQDTSNFRLKKLDESQDKKSISATSAHDPRSKVKVSSSDGDNPISHMKYDPKDKKESIKNWIKNSLDLNSLKMKTKDKWKSATTTKVAICQPNPRPLCPLSGQTICESINRRQRFTNDQSTQMSHSSSDNSCSGQSRRSRIYEEIDPIINSVVLDKSVINGRIGHHGTIADPLTRIPMNEWPRTMYTNRANLHDTVQLQQQLLKLSLREKGKNVQPSCPVTTQEWPQWSSKKEVKLMEEKVKRRKKSSIKKSFSFNQSTKRNSVPSDPRLMSTSNSVQQFYSTHVNYDDDDEDHIYDEVSPEHEATVFGEERPQDHKNVVGGWKIKKRPDGTRYVTKDDSRSKMVASSSFAEQSQKRSSDHRNLLDRVRRKEMTAIEKKRMSMVREEDTHDNCKSELLTVATV